MDAYSLKYLAELQPTNAYGESEYLRLCCTEASAVYKSIKFHGMYLKFHNANSAEKFTSYG